MSDGSIKFVLDTMLVDALIADPKTYKKAGAIADALSYVKSYFEQHIDKNDPEKSLINELAPGVLFGMLKSIGGGKLGLVLAILMTTLHIDVYGILTSIYSSIKEPITNGQKLSSKQIDEIVSDAMQDDNLNSSSLDLMHNAKMINLAVMQHEHETMRLTKKPGANSKIVLAAISRSVGVNILGKLLGWVFKIALWSAGFMIVGDIINKTLGRPNAIDKTYQPGKEEPATPAGPVSTQTKFKVKSDASLPSTWPLVNTPDNIENMLVQFAKDTYDGLDGKEEIIKNSPAFRMVKQNIMLFNLHNRNSSVIFIPSDFTSKKEIVDYFIDDVAKSSS
ncbi:MAG TPA: hypothetical protein VII94_05860 [Candidatus Saccharimonadales bacterium]